MSERLRWKLWGLVNRLPNVCPANSHEAIVSNLPDGRRSPFVDRTCRNDLERCGECWCGKLQRQPVSTDA